MNNLTSIRWETPYGTLLANLHHHKPIRLCLLPRISSNLKPIPTILPLNFIPQPVLQQISAHAHHLLNEA